MSESVVHDTIANLKPRIETILAEQRVVGAALGVVHHGELAWFGPWGHADSPALNSVKGDTGRVPDERTLYPVASNTKPFTGTAIMQLRDAGRLGLDDLLIEHIPEFEHAFVRHGSHRDITLRGLLTHTSGLCCEVPGNRFDTGVGPSQEELLARLDEVGVVVPPGAMHKYCNLGFALLGTVIERASGRSYDQYVRDEILAPLGMADSTFAVEGGEAPRAVPLRHDAEEVSPRPGVVMQHHAVAAAGGLKSNVRDMAKWLAHAATAARGEIPSPGVLRPETMREMLRPHARIVGWEHWQCLAWAVRVVDSRPLYAHGGSLSGALSQAMFSPPHDLAAVVLTNSDAHTAADDVATLLMTELAAALDAAAARWPVDMSPAPEDLRPYLGSYVGRLPALGGVLRIAWGNGQLMLVAENGPPPRRYETSGLRPAPSRVALIQRGVLRPVEGRWAGEDLRFHFDDVGAVTGFDAPSGSFMARMVPAEVGLW